MTSGFVSSSNGFAIPANGRFYSASGATRPAYPGPPASAYSTHPGHRRASRRLILNLPGVLGLVSDPVAVPRDWVSGLISYVGEADVPGGPAELMGRAKVWLATALRGTEVLLVQDAATGTLVGKSFSKLFVHAPEPNHHWREFSKA